MKKSVLLLLPILFATSLSACGKNGAGDNKTIQLYMWNSGLDVDWMKQMVNDFNNSQSEFKVEATYSNSAQTIIQTLAAGSGNYYDLYFTMLNTYQYNKDFIDMDWILDEKVDGEDVTVKDKYYGDLLKANEGADGKHKFLNYGNTFISIVYNKTIIDKTSFKDALPRTSNELKMLSAEINQLGTPTWLFYNEKYNNGYWDYVSNAWAAQYDGLDYYYNELLQLGGSTATKEEAKQAYLNKDGRYKALEAMESVITYANTHNKCSSTNFADVQNLFISGESALNINGGWLMKEYSKTGSGEKTNFGMMKLPVLSSIVETFEGEDKNMTDKTLSSIIEEIDNGAKSSTKCSIATFNRLVSARNLLSNNASQQYVFVPSYSNCIDGSKEFLRYFYSDKGTKTFIEKTGLPSSVKLVNKNLVDLSSLSDWNKQMFAFADSATALTYPINRSSILINSTLNLYGAVATAQSFRLPNGKNKTAATVWKEIVDTTEANWDDYAK